MTIITDVIYITQDGFTLQSIVIQWNLMSDPKITIYGAEWCGFCHTAKRYLDGKNIAYNYIDVDKDPAKGMEAVEKSGQRGIPVIDLDGEIVIGFDRPKIDAYISDKQLA